MDKREKVINGLEQFIADFKPFCGNKTDWQRVYDALALLKAQEPVEPVKVNRYMETDENGNWFSSETYDCGDCGVELHGKANYCHLCGMVVKWE